MLPIARSWLHAPDLNVLGTAFVSEGYSLDDRAYHFSTVAKKHSKLDMHLQASGSSPAVNPAFVVDGWGHVGAALRLNGHALIEGKDFRMGYIDRLEGSSLVVWVHAQLTSAADISVVPEELIRR
jgi:hypothetical protein